ncbi:hypothetical protein GF108_16685 [Phyllobacterium sp. SYP-B3895]|uniref:Nodulation protein n=2 Tax=Phyllobacteriaceae TaxID=69277 RepID=A0A849VNE8_9HYPH|nr:hypothetical protein [Phyllobacterium sp. SYP-B3895]NTS31432.1 hypothetical protein [Phyllobacterium pellucidum]
MSTASAQRGLWKLMLRLPAMRGQLQVLSARNTTLQSLCDAFDEASSTLDRLRRNGSKDLKLIAEYEMLCADIESEVIDICIATRGRSY